MASKKTTYSEPNRKSNKFRMVVFEGDFSDDSVAQIAQALTSALRPSGAPIGRQLSNGKQSPHALPIGPDEELVTDEEDETDFIDAHEEDSQEEEVSEPDRPPRQKVYKNPNFVELTWGGTGNPAVSLKDFAKEKAPKSKNRRYLVAAYWLKEHASHPNVNIDQMYSCFKTAGWPVGFKDWRAPFDNLVRADQMRKVGVGEFTITTVGEGALSSPKA